MSNRIVPAASQPKRQFSPRTEALAYRIWAYAQPLGWNADCQQIADALSTDADPVTFSTVVRVITLKGWNTRVRTRKLDSSGIGSTRLNGTPDIMSRLPEYGGSVE